MTAMMLTAIDAANGQILDITAMTLEQRDSVHGRRTASRHGYDLICKGCAASVHFVRNHHHTEFWRHGPDGARGCIVAGVSNGESAEHFEAKVTIVRSLRDLRGWTAQPERVVTLDGEKVKIDVYAEHDKPASHQAPVAWEVQVSRQTHGDFTERTATIQRVAGVHTSWVTPFDDELDLHQGIVTNRDIDLVIARIYTAPDEDAPPLPPMPLEEFIKKVSTRHPKLLWSASGENDRFIAFPRDSVANTPRKPKPEPVLGTLPDAEDRLCDRPPTQRRPLVRRDNDQDGFAVIRGQEQHVFGDFQTAASICRDVTVGRQRKCIAIACPELATDISGLCPKCITERLQRHPQPA